MATTKQPEVYNPLDKNNLGTSVADALLSRRGVDLPPPGKFLGAGVYAIYYAGSFEPYQPVAAVDRDDTRCPGYGAANPGRETSMPLSSKRLATSLGETLNFLAASSIESYE